MQTDLPEPVEPATRRCGVLLISHQITLPIIFLPKGHRSLEPSSDLGTFSKTSLKETEAVSLLAISIPTVFLPGIGACILTSLVAMAKAISL